MRVDLAMNPMSKHTKLDGCGHHAGVRGQPKPSHPFCRLAVTAKGAVFHFRARQMLQMAR